MYSCDINNYLTSHSFFPQANGVFKKHIQLGELYLIFINQKVEKPYEIASYIYLYGVNESTDIFRNFTIDGIEDLDFIFRKNGFFQFASVK